MCDVAIGWSGSGVLRHRQLNSRRCSVNMLRDGDGIDVGNSLVYNETKSYVLRSLDVEPLPYAGGGDFLADAPVPVVVVVVRKLLGTTSAPGGTCRMK